MASEKRTTDVQIGIRTSRMAAEQLKALREQLQNATPHGRVSLGDALAYAVNCAKVDLQAKHGRQTNVAA